MEKIIGLDIGGSKINAVVLQGIKVVKNQTVPTPHNLKSLEILLKGLVNTLDPKNEVKKIGIGIAGQIDPKGQRVVYSPNLRFVEKCNFSTLFLERVRVKVENDARCFAWANRQLGIGKRIKNFVGLTLGTGIGSGVVLEGKLYRGAYGGAGEVGHMPADGDHTYEELFQRARNKKDFAHMGRLVGNLLASITRVIDIEAVILGGGVTQNHHWQFLPQAVRVMKSQFKFSHAKPKVLVSKINSAGAIGAALLFQKP
jgi:glucokinase